eukprot:NODE_868_length_1586_cov_66.300891_g857_i0.p1 GENE.NODE_868_length_1586_cov_66.300891_g857_i0~~NODE_868_length_1586_cov_66.300891_g857_i0.p1  ORF type:complete len:461 (+),score=56.83 NODE_868_length_1586_cov_66.300891_g857_i0:59-1441(+)
MSEPPQKRRKVEEVVITDSDDEMVDEDADLARAIALSLQDSAPPAPRPTNPSSKRFTGKGFFLNRLDRLLHARTVTLEEILDKEHVQGGILTTYCLEPEFIVPKLPSGKGFTVVKHWATPHEKAGHFHVSADITALHPPLGQWTNMHAKLYILLFPTFVRIVVTSANLTHGEYNGIWQVFWIQDFPKQAQRSTPLGNKFRAELYAFLCVLPLSPTFLDAYDFADAGVELVFSVPGVNNKQKYGVDRIGALLREHQVIAGPPKGPFAAAKPLPEGSTARRLLGTRPVHCVSSLGGLTKEWWKYVTDKVGDAQIVFPTHSLVTASEQARNGGGVVCCWSKNWGGNGFPKQAMHQYAPNRDVVRTSHLCHGKVLCQLKKSEQGADATHFGWLLLGSHNLSFAAMGKPLKEGLRTSNYEASVFFPPQDVNVGTKEGGFPVPFDLQPEPYSAKDTPWLDMGGAAT